MSLTDLHSLIPVQRNGDGPDHTGSQGADTAVDGLPGVDDRGWVRVVSADLDMGGWIPSEPAIEP